MHITYLLHRTYGLVEATRRRRSADRHRVAMTSVHPPGLYAHALGRSSWGSGSSGLSFRYSGSSGRINDSQSMTAPLSCQCQQSAAATASVRRPSSTSVDSAGHRWLSGRHRLHVHVQQCGNPTCQPQLDNGQSCRLASQVAGSSSVAGGCATTPKHALSSLVPSVSIWNGRWWCSQFHVPIGCEHWQHFFVLCEPSAHTSFRRPGRLGGTTDRCPAAADTSGSRTAGRARADGAGRTASDGLRCPQRSTTGAAQTLGGIPQQIDKCLTPDHF